jgi:hypothetical protein
MLAPMGIAPTSKSVFTVKRRVPPVLARKDSTLPMPSTMPVNTE